MALEQSLTLSQLEFDALGVSSRSQCLSVTVLLVALDASGSTGSASWMFGIALEIKESISSVRCWAAPGDTDGKCQQSGLALIFFPLHLAQASCDRRSRRGSLGPCGPSSFPPSFFRLRLAPAVGVDAGGVSWFGDGCLIGIGGGGFICKADCSDDGTAPESCWLVLGSWLESIIATDRLAKA